MARETPYFVDTPTAHDQDLIFNREFGSNINPPIGDAFVTTTAVEVDAGASVNARTGMLELTTLEDQGEFPEPRGRSFLLPAWSTLPESPFLGAGTRAMVIYSHVLYRQEPFLFEDPPFVDLILGDDALIGHAPSTPFITASIESQFNQMGPNVTPAALNMSQWDTGPSGPEVADTGDFWGKDIYFRVLIINDELKGSDLQIEVSETGLAWTVLAFGSIGDEIELRRVGLSVRGRCMGALDWIRAYSYVITGSEGFFIPLLPETGSRLFIR